MSTGPGHPLRRAWRVASRPGVFFAGDAEDGRLAPALSTAAVSGLVASLAVAWMLLLWTESSGWLPVLLLTPLVTLPYLALLVFVGGLLLLRPTTLQERAWALVAWCWAPAGFLGVALLPIGSVAPGPTLLGFALMLPAWHLWLLRVGLRTCAPERAGAAWLLYLGVVFVLPVAAAAGLLSLLAQGA